MHNQTHTRYSGYKDRLYSAIEVLRSPIFHILAGVAGFLFAGTSMPWGISPFAIAWVSAQDSYALSAALGGILGCFINPDPGITMRSVAAITLLLGLRWVFLATGRRSTVMAFSPLIAGFALAVTYIAVVIGSGVSYYLLMSALAEIILATGAGYFFIRAQVVIDAGGCVLRQSDYVCLSVAGGLFAMSVMRPEIAGFSPGRACVVLAIFMGAYYGGAGIGAIVGTVVSVAAVLASQPDLMPLYAVGGLCAGVFAPAGRLMSAAVFALVGGIAGIATGGGGLVMSAIAETTAASVVFLLMPANPGFVKYLKAVVRGTDTAVSAQLAGVRLQKAAAVLTEIAQITEEVAGRLGALAGDDIERVYASVADAVCKCCRQSPACWQSGYSDTMAALSQAGAQMRAGGQLSPATLPESLKRVCIHPDKMADELSRQVGDYLSRQGARRQAGRMRSVVNDQFTGMAMLLTGIKEELGGVRAGSRTVQSTAEQYFAGLDIEPVTVICYEDCDNRQILDVTLPAYKLGRVNQTDAAIAMSEICEEKMGIPEVYHSADTVQLIFAPVAELVPSFACVQRAAGGSRLCGDSFISWSDRLGGASMVLSDGMGAGGAAAVDSALTTTLISRLVGAGARFDAALRMVNSALLVKSPDESLTTVDACEIDLYTGRANFYKAGAAPSFVLRSGRVATVESASLPAGILRGVTFEQSCLTLSAGDRVVMVSDGITATGSEWVPSELGMLRELDDEELCRRLIKTAEDRLSGERKDDMTVAVMSLAAGEV